MPQNNPTDTLFNFIDCDDAEKHLCCDVCARSLQMFRAMPVCASTVL